MAWLVWGQYEQPWQLTLALILSGVGLIAGGFETLFTQRGRLLDWLGQKGDDWGFAFYPWAVVFFLAGLALLVTGMLRLLGLIQRIWRSTCPSGQAWRCLQAASRSSQPGWRRSSVQLPGGLHRSHSSSAFRHGCSGCS